MQEELEKRPFVPQWLLGTVDDPTFDAGSRRASSKIEKVFTVERASRLSHTGVALSERKLRVA